MDRVAADCVVGMGANLGDRRSTLAAAVRACAQLGRLTAVSALYETRPVGGPPQPDFLNSAVRLSTRLGPRALLLRLLEIERQAGRRRVERWGPRVLDLDLLWIRGVAVRQADLTIPHPRLLGRAFALIPLLEVAPDAKDPVSGQPYAEAARTVDASGVRLVESADQWVGADA